MSIKAMCCANLNLLMMFGGLLSKFGPGAKAAFRANFDLWAKLELVTTLVFVVESFFKEKLID